MQEFQLVIMAGGKGTRIRSVAEDIPKPMIQVAGKSVLEHQIDFFSKRGVKNITISVGHLGHVIKKYFGDGERFGVKIKYIEEEEPLGSAGALKFTDEEPNLLMVVNGDILFNFDLQRMLNFHKEKFADITLFTHPNHHPYDSSIIDADDDGRILKWYNKEDFRENVPNRVNAGIHLINREALDLNSEIWLKKKVDLDREILKPNVAKKKIFAYDSPEYVKDMGTPDRLKRVEEDFFSGIISAKNLEKKQFAIFLDRDGTINKHVGFITKPEQIELLEGAAEAIKKINQSSYLAIVVSNQPVVARGECTFEELKKIHNRLEMLLGEKGAYLDDIIFCPHHPDKGFVGEVSELKIDCDCRKPKPGMILKAAEKYNIDLKNSCVIGDDLRDMKAGIAAGCKTIFIGEKNKINCQNFSYAENLFQAVKFFFNA